MRGGQGSGGSRPPRGGAPRGGPPRGGPKRGPTPNPSRSPTARAGLPNAKAFAVVPPGLEKLLHDELAALGVPSVIDEGGVTFDATPAALARVHTWSRIAAHVRVRIGRFPATSLEALANGLRALPWRAVGESGQPVEVDATSRGSALRHRDGMARKAELAIVDALRGPRLSALPPSKEPLVAQLRVIDDQVTASVDASGAPLHARGWRLETAKAPLRENLAAAVLAAAGWQPGTPLVDPMCGAGTFPIEAARWAAGLPPRLDRSYACARWTPAEVWQAARARPSAVRTPILAADRDPGAVRATTGNAARAGVTARIVVTQSTFETLTPPAEVGLLVANLPYGVRVAEESDIDAMYARWGHILRERWTGWRAVFLAADIRRLGRLDRRIQRVAEFDNGGMPVVVGLLDRA